MIGRQVKICTGFTQSIQILRRKKIKKIYCPMTAKSKDPNTNILGQTSHKAKLKIDIKSKYYYNTVAEFINLVANSLRRRFEPFSNHRTDGLTKKL